MPREKIITWFAKRRDGSSKEDREFLPAALELVETPASPAGRLVAFTIAMAAVVAIAWAFIGKVDVIATAPGRIVPVGKTKLIQPMEIGVVTAIHVSDGDNVRAGDVLIELDPAQASAERDKFLRDLKQARFDLARLQGLRENLEAGVALKLVAPPPDTTNADMVSAQASMRARAEEQRAKLADLEQQIAEKNSEIDTATASADRLRASLPLVQQQSDMREELLKLKYANQMSYLTSKQQLVEQQHQITVLERQREQSSAAERALEQRREQAIAEYRKNVFEDLDKARRQVSDLEAEFTKAQKTLMFKTLRAPVDGTVQQLAIHTIGGVVTPAQPLLMIVPNETGLTVEAMVSNLDIGFVHAGQPAEVKIDTFNFTRYGLIDGTVTALSHDSVTQEVDTKRTKSPDDSDSNDKPSAGSAYIAHIALSRNWMDTETGRLSLGPGMSVTTEIHTGSRRIIDFLLSPLSRKVAESLHER